jgi:hypothetical protein
MLTPRAVVDSAAGFHYGYGWRIEESGSGTLVRHGGSNLVFYADVRWYVDRDVKLILLTNAFDVDGLREVLRGLLGILVA